MVEDDVDEENHPFLLELPEDPLKLAVLLLIRANKQQIRELQMTFQTVVGVGSSSLLYGSQVKGVVSDGKLLIEELFPFSVGSDAPRKHRHFS